jgi:peptidoglycan/LPS O-acetylase OafA/YrhL
VRGLAILLVFVWHYASFAAVPGTPLAYALVPMRMWYTGVDLFFVLSGFLIGGILVDTRDRPDYFPSFYRRRAARILPLYALCLALFGVAAWLNTNEVAGLRTIANRPLPWHAYVTMTQNLWMLREGATINGVSVTWSLAVEEQVYLFLPLLVLWCPRKLLPYLAAGLVGTALVCRAIWPEAATLTLARLDAIGLGMVAALLVRHPRAWQSIATRPTVGWALLTVSVLSLALLTLHVVDPAGNGYALVAIGYAALLIAALRSDSSTLARVFSHPWLRWMGKVSYATYLIHMPVLFLAHGLLIHRDEHYPVITDWASAVVTLGSVVVTLLLAAASWRWFEGPILASQRGESRAPTLPRPIHGAQEPRFSEPPLRPNAAPPVPTPSPGSPPQ